MSRPVQQQKRKGALSGCPFPLWPTAAADATHQVEDKRELGTAPGAEGKSRAAGTHLRTEWRQVLDEVVGVEGVPVWGGILGVHSGCLLHVGAVGLEVHQLVARLQLIDGQGLSIFRVWARINSKTLEAQLCVRFVEQLVHW